MVMLTESGARRHVNRWGVVMVETSAGARASLSRPVRQEGVHLAMLRLEIEYFGPQVAASRSAIRTISAMGIVVMLAGSMARLAEVAGSCTRLAFSYLLY